MLGHNHPSMNFSMESAGKLTGFWLTGLSKTLQRPLELGTRLVPSEKRAGKSVIGRLLRDGLSLVLRRPISIVGIYLWPHQLLDLEEEEEEE